MERIENLRKEKDKKIEEERMKSDKHLLRKQNSSLVGADGEEICLSNLTLLFPAAKIEDTHTEAGRGDFFFNYQDLEKQHEIGVSLDVLIVVPGETIEEAIKNMQELSKEELLKNAINHLPFEGALSRN